MEDIERIKTGKHSGLPFLKFLLLEIRFKVSAFLELVKRAGIAARMHSTFHCRSRAQPN
jgi:hypothetical protein